ncbi:MAG: ABC transporter permease, partial [Roseovarius sp.]|nr:ABC transporter permease [Roseovarius sp.]
MGWLMFGAGVWGLGWWINSRLSHRPKTRLTSLLVPVIFGLTLVVIWESLVRGLNISPILLPPPTAIAATFAKSTDILWQDFVQTALKGALSGYIIGCGLAFLIAVAIDRFPFL